MVGLFKRYGYLAIKYNVSYDIWTLFTIFCRARGLILYLFGHRALQSVIIKELMFLCCRDFHLAVDFTENLLLKRFELSYYRLSVLIVSYSIRLATEPHSQWWNKILITEYDFAVNVVTATNNAIHKAFIGHDLDNKLFIAKKCL